MKKILSITIVTMFVLSANHSNAQMKKGAYVGLNFGYNAPAGAGNFDAISVVNSTSTNTSYSIENIKFSFGKGVSTGLAFGYMFNENIGAELGVQYLLGGKTKYTQTFTFTNTSITTGDISAKMFQIKPSIVLATTIKKTTPYAKFGMVIGSGKILSNEKSIRNLNNTTEETVEFKGGISLGYSAAVGLNFPINKNIAINSEINMVNMQYSPKKAILTKATSNGVDQLPSYNTSQKEIDFVKKLVINGSAPAPTNIPAQQPAFASAFGSIGISVGLKYSF